MKKKIKSFDAIKYQRSVQCGTFKTDARAILNIDFTWFYQTLQIARFIRETYCVGYNLIVAQARLKI